MQKFATKNVQAMLKQSQNLSAPQVHTVKNIRYSKPTIPSAIKLSCSSSADLIVGSSNSKHSLMFMHTSNEHTMGCRVI